MFNSELNVMKVELQTADDFVKVVLSLGLVVPVLDPGTGQLQGVPVVGGIVNFNLNQEMAEKLAAGLTEASKGLTKPSEIVVASDMRQAQQVADLDKKFRGPNA